MDSVSSLEKFDNDLSFAIDTAHKSIVWIDCFDFGYIKKLLDKLSKSHQSYNFRYWSNSTGEIRNSSGDQHVKVKVNRKNEKDLTVVTSIETVVSFTEALKWFVNTPKCTHLVLKVSENNFLEKEAIPTLQEFVCLNEEETSDIRRTIILVAATHIEVPGLEHICERFTMPLPDVEDIDFELGFINTNCIIRDKNDKKKIIRVVDGDNELTKVKEAVEQDKEKGYIMKDNTKGLVYRDKQRQVIDMVYNDYKKLKYPFNSDFVDVDKFKTNYQKLVDSLCGMHIYDIRELLNTLLAKGNSNTIQLGYDDGGCLWDIIRERKKQIAINSGLLEIIDCDEDQCDKVADIGALKEYIENEKDRIDNPNRYPPKLSKPKGILLVGAPGCGKSESAKAIASMLKKPLYRLDIGKLLGHKYGQSENRFIEALHTADASAPCVLWIDEIEKAFAGAGNESENDDTLTHIVGYFLTWMQEHPTMVYLVATANDLSRMKPEMLRKGRWDETFYLNYPSEEGCKSILETILEKKFEIKLKESGTESIQTIQTLAKVMSRIPMSGAEIENVIVETVKYKSEYCKESKTWRINDYDIAYILLKCLKEKKIGEELSKLTKEDLKEKEPKDWFDLLNNYKEKSNNNVKDKDPFLAKKVDDEILEMKIRNFGRFDEKKDVPNLRKLLEEKYKGQYNFKPASKFY